MLWDRSLFEAFIQSASVAGHLDEEQNGLSAHELCLFMVGSLRETSPSLFVQEVNRVIWDRSLFEAFRQSASVAGHLHEEQNGLSAHELCRFMVVNSRHLIILV